MKEALEKAQRKVRNAWIAGIVVGVVGFIMATVYYFLSVESSETMLSKIFLSLIIIGLAFGIKKHSRTCAITIFIWFISAYFTSYVYAIINKTSTGSLVGVLISIVILYYAFEGIRGAFAYHSLRCKEDPNYKPTSKMFYYISIPLGIIFFALFGYWAITTYIQTDKLSLKEIFNKNNEAVVLISAYDKNGNVESFGSGVCIHSEGVILTNLHVLDSDTTYLDIKFQKHGVYEDVYVAGVSPISEDYLALRVYEKDLPSVNISTRNEYDIGEKIITIGNPEGLLNSISEGIISGRRFYGDHEYYQMTAPVSYGSSGGAVFDEYGYLIGISTGILEEGQNLNFFLPINRINNVETFDTNLTIRQFNNLRRSNKKKEDSTPLIPEELQEENRKLDKFLSGLVVAEKELGVKIVEITQGCPAWDSGLSTGDIIAEIEGKEIKSLEGYVEITQNLNKTGRLKIALVVNRRGVLYDVSVKRTN